MRSSEISIKNNTICQILNKVFTPLAATCLEVSERDFKNQAAKPTNIEKFIDLVFVLRSLGKKSDTNIIAQNRILTDSLAVKNKIIHILNLILNSEPSASKYLIKFIIKLPEYHFHFFVHYLLKNNHDIDFVKIVEILLEKNEVEDTCSQQRKKFTLNIILNSNSLPKKNLSNLSYGSEFEKNSLLVLAYQKIHSAFNHEDKEIGFHAAKYLIDLGALDLEIDHQETKIMDAKIIDQSLLFANIFYSFIKEKTTIGLQINIEEKIVKEISDKFKNLIYVAKNKFKTNENSANNMLLADTIILSIMHFSVKDKNYAPINKMFDLIIDNVDCNLHTKHNMIMDILNSQPEPYFQKFLKKIKNLNNREFNAQLVYLILDKDVWLKPIIAYCNLHKEFYQNYEKYKKNNPPASTVNIFEDLIKFITSNYCESPVNILKKWTQRFTDEFSQNPIKILADNDKANQNFLFRFFTRTKAPDSLELLIKYIENYVVAMAPIQKFIDMNNEINEATIFLNAVKSAPSCGLVSQLPSFPTSHL